MRADLLMLLAAMIWGCSFVAQRESLSTMGPIFYNGVRFLLGAVVVAGYTLWRTRSVARTPQASQQLRASRAGAWAAGSLLGGLVAVSICAQQIGLRYTQVANAGFITAMYVVIVPWLSILRGQRVRLVTGLGAASAAVGLYYLSGERWSLSYGDALELFGACVSSVQLICIGAWTQTYEPVRLALIQCIVCGLLCLGVACFVEPIHWQEIERSALTLFVGGALSVGIANTIQMIAQRDAQPSHAAIIFSTEGVFAALAAWIVLGQTLTPHAIGGCALVVLGCVLCQLMPARARAA